MDKIIKLIGAILGMILVIYTAILYESIGLLFFGICIPLVIVAEIVLLRILRGKLNVTLQLNQHHLTINDSVDVTVVLYNTSVLPMVNTKLVIACGDQLETKIVHLSGKETKQISVSFAQEHCGWYVARISSVQISDWLSFYKVYRKTVETGQPSDLEESLYVYPKQMKVEIPALTIMETEESEETEEVHSGGLQDQFVGIKEYQPGDRLHKINWKLTAKTGDLLVKQYAASAQLSAMLYLDLRVLRTLMPQQQDDVYEEFMGLSHSLLESGIHHMIAFPIFEEGLVQLVRYLITNEKQMYELMRIVYRQMMNWHKPGIGLEQEGEYYVRSLPNGYHNDTNCIYLFDGSGLDLQHSSSYFTDCHW